MLMTSLLLALIHMPSIVLSTTFNWILQSRIWDHYISFWALKLYLSPMVSSLHNVDISWISSLTKMTYAKPISSPMSSAHNLLTHCPILLSIGVQWVLCNIFLLLDMTFPLQSSVYYAISSTLFLMVSFSQRAHHLC